ncbi:MAG: hypothetical protein IJ909_01160 [Fibrobacter sp.]|nr:hypothetical protein [Fibrobacter sp.]
MVNFHLLTRKILKGIRIKYGQNLLYGEDQRVSEKSGKVYTEYRVSLSVTTEKYNEMHPGEKLNPKIHTSKYATIPLFKTVKIEELFLYLYNDIWRKLESGEMYEQGEREREKVRGRRRNRRGKRAGSSAGVLQDALTGEELPGGISEGECERSAGEGAVDTGEA